MTFLRVLLAMLAILWTLGPALAIGELASSGATGTDVDAQENHAPGCGPAQCEGPCAPTDYPLQVITPPRQAFEWTPAVEAPGLALPPRHRPPITLVSGSKPIANETPDTTEI